MGWMILLALALAWTGQAESGAQSDAEFVRAWLKVCTARAKNYRIHPTGKAEDEFQLLPSPVFYHNQPVRGDDIGAVYVWVQGDGRPAVIGAVFGFSTSSPRDGSRTVYHVMHSLAEVPLTAVWRGEAESVEAQFQWKPIPDAPAPADSPEQRLRQIRSLSERFKAHSVDFRGGRWELRLIPKPVYRYELEKPDAVLDGALLAICQGTDPEIFLAIEARKGGDGYRWHYACAAFSDYELHAQFDDTEVWAPPKGVSNSRREPHWWYGYVERTRLPEENSEAKD